MDTERRENLVWAVDPFWEKNVPLAKARHLLATLRKKLSLNVEPVAVVSPKEAGWPVEFEDRWSESFVEVASTSLRKLQHRLRMPEVTAPKILVEPSVERAESIAALLRFAAEEHAKMIMVNLHSREGFRRFRIGSFTESLISISPLPVLTVRTNTRVPNQIQTILFPTDLSPGDESYFRPVLELAEKFQAKIVVMHRLEVPAIFAADWIGFAAVGEVEAMREVMRENEQTKRAEGERLVRIANARGLRAEFLLTKGMTSLGQAIVRVAADTKTDLLTVAAQDHSFTQKILGGAAREVLRLSPRPVLVLPNAA